MDFIHPWYQYEDYDQYEDNQYQVQCSKIIHKAWYMLMVRGKVLTLDCADHMSDMPLNLGSEIWCLAWFHCRMLQWGPKEEGALGSSVHQPAQSQGLIGKTWSNTLYIYQEV